MGRIRFAVLMSMLMGLGTLSQAADPHAGHAAGGELKHGRYVGWIQFDDHSERLALTADFFLESPEDFTQFPSLNAIFKMSLGGYNSDEYMTETFTDLRYDFDNGGLTLDEPANDLVMTSEVHTMGSSTLIMGEVFIRSSAVSGKLYLKYEPEKRTSRVSQERTTSPAPTSREKRKKRAPSFPCSKASTRACAARNAPFCNCKRSEA